MPIIKSRGPISPVTTTTVPEVTQEEEEPKPVAQPEVVVSKPADIGELKDPGKEGKDEGEDEERINVGTWTVTKRTGGINITPGRTGGANSYSNRAYEITSPEGGRLVVALGFIPKPSENQEPIADQDKTSEITEKPKEEEMAQSTETEEATTSEE
jgi:hypothetical protein